MRQVAATKEPPFTAIKSQEFTYPCSDEATSVVLM